MPTARQFSVGNLLHADPVCLGQTAKRGHGRDLAFHCFVLVLGTGLYGAAMGLWRSPEQALFVGIKFPLIVIATAFGNALLNGMLAPLLGLNISWRQSFSANLAAFGIAGAIMAGFAPVVLFMLWNVPPMTANSAVSRPVYNAILLSHVIVIAFAGITANAKLFSLLKHWSGSPAVATRVLFAWLAGNLFLGSQLSWILRPFIGSPNLPVEFLRATAFHGNFYESVFRSFLNVLNH